MQNGNLQIFQFDGVFKRAQYSKFKINTSKMCLVEGGHHLAKVKYYIYIMFGQNESDSQSRCLS